MNAIARDGRVCVTIPDVRRQTWDDKPVKVIIEEKSSRTKAKTYLLTRLQEIKINVPEDFCENVDAYLNGEKNAYSCSTIN